MFSMLEFGDIGYVIEVYSDENYESKFSLPSWDSKAIFALPVAYVELAD